MIFRNDETYNKLKAIALYVLPAIEFLVSALVEIWKIPYGSGIVATLVAVDGSIGILLGKSSKKFNEINIEFENEENIDHEIIEEE